MKILFLILLTLFFANCCNAESETAEELFVGISKIYNRDICKTPYVDKFVYSEAATYDDKYVMYDQATGYLISEGYDSNIPMGNFAFVFSNFGKSDRKVNWLKYLRYSYMKYSYIKKCSNIKPGYNSIVNSFRRLEMHGPLNEDYESDYKYSFVKTSSEIKQIKFELEGGGRNTFNGVVFYHSLTKKIEKIVLAKARFYSYVFQKLDYAEMIFEFKYIDKSCYLSNANVVYRKKKLNQTINLQLTGTPSKGLSLTLHEFGVLSIYDNSLFVKYHDNLKLTRKDIDLIRKDLEVDNVSLEKQFSNNSDKFYCNTTLKNGTLQKENFFEEYQKIQIKFLNKYEK